MWLFARLHQGVDFENPATSAGPKERKAAPRQTVKKNYTEAEIALPKSSVLAFPPMSGVNGA